jgi:branched-chain amino acid transport system substrate-binding protein
MKDEEKRVFQPVARGGSRSIDSKEGEKMKRYCRVMSSFLILLVAIFFITSMGWGQSKVVKIGFIGPLTGPNAAQGVGARNAFDLAIREANASGKYPYKIEMVALDDASDPATGVAAALKLVSDPAVVAASGHWNSPVALATIHTFHTYRIPFIVWGAIHPDITGFYKYPGVNRVAPTLVQENGPLCDWVITELGYKAFSIISDTSSYGEMNMKAFRPMAENKGAKILSVDSVTVGTTDFRPVLTKIKGLNPDAVYFGGVVMEGALIKDQMEKVGLKRVFCAISGIKDDKFLEVAGPSGEGVLSIKPGKPIEKLEGGTKFVKSYEIAGYREPFGAYGPNAYDSAGIILEAFSKVGPDDKAAITKYIRGIKYKGLMGETTFDATGQTTNLIVSRFIGQDGKWVTWEDSAYSKGVRKLPKP